MYGRRSSSPSKSLEYINKNVRSRTVSSISSGRSLNLYKKNITTSRWLITLFSSICRAWLSLSLHSVHVLSLIVTSCSIGALEILYNNNNTQLLTYVLTHQAVILTNTSYFWLKFITQLNKSCTVGSRSNLYDRRLVAVARSLGVVGGRPNFAHTGHIVFKKMDAKSFQIPKGPIRWFWSLFQRSWASSELKLGCCGWWTRPLTQPAVAV